jgi:hypothetical protein
MLSLARTLMVLGAVALVATGGCNSVLGIDEAHLNEASSGGSSSNAGGSTRVTAPPAKNCFEPTKACSDCLATQDCTDAKNACLASASCRAGLNTYRGCLGTQCADPDGKCLADFSALESRLNPGSIGLAACVQNTCATECKGMPLVNLCELYCSCMAPNCTGELALAGTPLNDCMTMCAAVTPADTTCRWTHCEIAPAHPNMGHCGHAVGQLVCNATTTISHTCQGKSQSSYACDTGDDCCSGKCNHNICD